MEIEAQSCGQSKSERSVEESEELIGKQELLVGVTVSSVVTYHA